MANRPPLNPITDIINHPAVYNGYDGAHWMSYADFCQNTPVMETYTNIGCLVTTNYTNEIHKKSWLTMSTLSFDVREQGYTLSAATFAVNNMVIVNGKDLKFVHLFGQKGSTLDTPDFTAISDIIKQCVGQPCNGDVHSLIMLLENNPLDSFHKSLIKCNYALMPNPMRKAFLMWLWDRIHDTAYTNWAVETVINDYEIIDDWRARVKNMPRSPLHSVYTHIPGAYNGNSSHELQKFVRNALHHLTENGIPEERTLLVVEGFLGGYTLGLQYYVAFNGGLTPSDLERFTPQP